LLGLPASYTAPPTNRHRLSNPNPNQHTTPNRHPTPKVNCFIVKKGTPGFKATKIDNKIALRCVQNADMVFERCFVPDAARLPGEGAGRCWLSLTALAWTACWAPQKGALLMSVCACLH
jgi:hypothetical protein